MQGYQLTLITQQGRCHQGQPICNWLLQETRRLDVCGATVLVVSKDFGQSG